MPPPFYALLDRSPVRPDDEDPLPNLHHRRAGRGLQQRRRHAPQSPGHGAVASGHNTCSSRRNSSSTVYMGHFREKWPIFFASNSASPTHVKINLPTLSHFSSPDLPSSPTAESPQLHQVSPHK